LEKHWQEMLCNSDYSATRCPTVNAQQDTLEENGDHRLLGLNPRSTETQEEGVDGSGESTGLQTPTSTDSESENERKGDGIVSFEPESARRQYSSARIGLYQN